MSKKVTKTAKPSQKVYVVTDELNAPGKILAIFADKETANWFADCCEGEHNAAVEERTLFYGQPPVRGYNQ